jgi:hypothetical protein
MMWRSGRLWDWKDELTKADNPLALYPASFSPIRAMRAFISGCSISDTKVEDLAGRFQILEKGKPGDHLRA